MKRETKITAAVVTAIAFAGAFGFAVDRPVSYRFEFLPVREDVIELVAENTADKLQRAIEQKDRNAERIQRKKAKGVPVSADEKAQLRFWKKRVILLQRKFKKLDK